VGTARKAIELIRSPDFDPGSYPKIQERTEDRMTARLSEIFSQARQAIGISPDQVRGQLSPRARALGRARSWFGCHRNPNSWSRTRFCRSA
jgi:hypothetical protein